MVPLINHKLPVRGAVRITVVVLVIISFFNAASPGYSVVNNLSYGWTQTFYGSDLMGVGPRDIAVDSEGNSYTVGYFFETVDFDPTAAVDSHTSSGGGDMFISKFTQSGEYVWAKTFGYAGTMFNMDELTSVCIDADDNIFVAGDFEGTSVDLDATAGVDEYDSNGSSDFFISKYDSDFNYLWTRKIGGSLVDGVNSCATDEAGAVYITGYFKDVDVDFDGTGGTDLHSIDPTSTYGAYLTKYLPDGSYGWTYSFGEGYSIGRNIVAGETAVYFTGIFNNTIDFNDAGGDDVRTSTNNHDTFITKYLTNGSYGWTRTITHDSSSYPSGIALDSSENPIVSGYFRGLVVDFDGTTGGDIHSSLNASYDNGFVLKYFSDGSYGWANTYGAADTNDTTYDVAVNRYDQILFTGVFYASVDLDPTDGVDTFTPSGSAAAHYTKYGGDGSYIGSAMIEPKGNDCLLSYDQNNGVVIAGSYMQTTDFDVTAGTDTHTIPDSRTGTFISYYDDDMQSPSITLYESLFPEIRGVVSDNAVAISSVEYQMDGTSGAWVPCTAGDGTFDETTEEFVCLDVSDFGPGTYTVYIRATDLFGNITGVGSEVSQVIVVEDEELIDTGQAIAVWIIAGMGVTGLALLTVRTKLQEKYGRGPF